MTFREWLEKEGYTPEAILDQPFRIMEEQDWTGFVSLNHGRANYLVVSAQVPNRWNFEN